MASVSGVSNSNANSLYGNRNVLTGLASGMDTESMIENSVKGIRLKMTGISQKQTKLQWKQEAYQSITDKLVQFSRKYTSYTSATNLLSPSFFNKAVTTTSNGANAACVSATGRTSSNVQIDAVAQLATASRYETSSSEILNTVLHEDGTLKPIIQAGSAINLQGSTDLSKVSGTMTLAYGSQSLSLNFGETETYNNVDEYVTAIRQKLSNQTIAFSDGSIATADKAIGVSVVDGNIKFTDNKASGNTVYISGVSGKLAETFASTPFNSETKQNTLPMSGMTELKYSAQIMDLTSGKSMTFTLDGTKKTITLPTKDEITAKGGSADTAFKDLLQDKLTAAFGANKIAVSDQAADPDTNLQLRFTIEKGSSLSVSSDVNTTLGLSKSASTSLDTSKTLGALLGSTGSTLGTLTGGVLLKAEGTVKKQTDGSYRDSKGNLVNAGGERLGSDGNLLYGFDLKLNDKVLGTYTRDTALDSILVDINSNTELGFSVNYSKTTNQFVLNAKDTGEGHTLSFGAGLAQSIFGSSQVATQGKDAKIKMTVNGSTLEVTRSSNTFDVDGLSVTVKSTFNGSMNGSTPSYNSPAADPVTFKTTTNADTIVNAVKSMVEDYNAAIKEIHSAFSTLPAQKANKSRYEPLTDEDKENMTETSIKNYEEKAKQGTLFGDTDLSSLYSKLCSAISPTGTDGTTLRSIGISTDYYQGQTTISLDETKLRDMLSSNPDAVRDAFTKVAGDGSSTNGLMKNLKTQLDTYAATEGVKGILINKAGSKYSAASILKNSIKSQIDSYETERDKWQDQLSTKVDYYTRQFTRLEQLISQMNAQSSQISGLMGG